LSADVSSFLKVSNFRKLKHNLSETRGVPEGPQENSPGWSEAQSGESQPSDLAPRRVAAKSWELVRAFASL